MAYNNNIPSYHDLRGLSIVWLRAIALAWEYQELLSGQDLLDKSGRPVKNIPSDSTPEIFKAARFLNLLTVNVLQALAEYFNYQCPFSVNLKANLGTPNPAAWNKTTTGGSGKPTPGDWDWSCVPPNQINFHLPSNPILRWTPWGSPVTGGLALTSPITDDLAMGDEAIALAAYLDSGSSYLFSCC